MNKCEKNGMWKGDKVKYRALHAWVQRNKPKPQICEHCNQKKKLELANISGKYKRDVNDYKYLCAKCHKIMDREKRWFNDKVKQIGIRFRNNRWEPRIKFRGKAIYLGKFKTKEEAKKVRNKTIDYIRKKLKEEWAMRKIKKIDE